MVTKKGLGKGLDSMIPDKVIHTASKEKAAEENILFETWIKLNEIEPNNQQPRKNFNEDTLLELAESIKQYGIIQPLLVQKKENGYELIAGERRWRAARIAGLKEVPALIKEYSAQEVMEIALIENLQREDLNPIEEAKAYQRLIQEYHLKQDEVAEKVSKSRVTITNTMRLLKLDPRVQQMLIDGMISSGHARTILTIEDPEQQLTIATKVFDEKLSVRDTEKLIRSILEDNKKSSIKEKLQENYFIYKDLEQKITGVVGSRVSINQKGKNKGKIEIEYYSNEELDRIVDLFMNINK